MANRHVRIRGELRAARRLFPVASAAPSQPSAKRTSVTGSHLAVVGNGLEVGGPAWLGPSLGFPDLGAFCTITGDRNLVNGRECTVYGDMNTVGGANCLVEGANNYVSGRNCVVYGRNNVVVGSGSKSYPPRAARIRLHPYCARRRLVRANTRPLDAEMSAEELMERHQRDFEEGERAYADSEETHERALLEDYSASYLHECGSQQPPALDHKAKAALADFFS